MKTQWYRETVDLFFKGHYEKTFRETIASLVQKGVVHTEVERYMTTIKT